MRLQIPDLLMAAVELDGGADGLDRGRAMDAAEARSRAASSSVEPPSPAASSGGSSAYCEYFRRQLASVDDVDAVLAEIDSQQRKP